MSIYVDGNTVRKTEMPYVADREGAEKAMLARKKAKLEAQQLKVAEQMRFAKVLLGMAATAVFAAICMLMLSQVVKNNSLTSEIRKLEAELSEITSQNDSKEYDISSTVDLNTVMQVATEQLGMVRSTAGQIITFQSSEGEYIQQVAELPKN